MYIYIYLHACIRICVNMLMYLYSSMAWVRLCASLVALIVGAYCCMASRLIIMQEVLHTHTHTYYTHKTHIRHTHIHTNTQTHTDTHRHTQTHTDTHRHTQTHTDTHRLFVWAYCCLASRFLLQEVLHTHTHTYYTHKTHTFPPFHTDSIMQEVFHTYDSHIHTDTHRHTQTHTDTHRHTQTHTDTHTHTRTHTHPRISVCFRTS